MTRRRLHTKATSIRACATLVRRAVRGGLVFGLFALALFWSRTSWAQACCAGAGAVTPGRLALHEDALVGVQMRAAHVYGAWGAHADYASASAGTSEQDFEQDLIGSIRLPVLDRAQMALLVPFVETRRKADGVSDFGGGLGDVNLSARYDFYYAGQSRIIPGVALLAGLTFPAGKSPESATHELATDATGAGAWQINAGLNLEQTFGRWLVTAYGIVAKRMSRTIESTNAPPVESTLGTQWTALGAVAYTFPGDYAVALSASYTIEGDAELNGERSPDSARRVPILGASGVVPFTDHFRLQGGVSFNPPIDELGKNQIATVAINATAVYAWY